MKTCSIEERPISHNAADRQLIQDAIAGYAWGFDTADFALLGEAFTERRHERRAS